MTRPSAARRCARQVRAVASARRNCHREQMPINEVDGSALAARLTRLGGVAAFLGGLAWTLKGIVILAGGEQPPLLFEAAPALFGLGLLSVAFDEMPHSRRRGFALGLLE